MRTSIILTLALALLFSPCSASACWDGAAAAVGRVAIRDASERTTWDPAEVANYALWLGRINALLPANGSLALDFNTGEFDCGDHTADIPWNGSLSSLFRQVAAECHVTRAQRAHAMSTTTTLYTVQVGAHRDAANARRLADEVNAHDIGAHGFIEVGGFPATNPTAHIVSSNAMHRVWVGAFVERAEAELMATAFGGGAYVRVLEFR